MVVFSAENVRHPAAAVALALTLAGWASPCVTQLGSGQLAKPQLGQGASASPPPEKWVGAFVPFPGSRLLCRQHVIGAGAAPSHIDWTLYATERPPSEVRAFYTEHPGRQEAKAPAEVQLRVGKKLLVAYPSASKAYPRCGVEPKTTDKTAIVVSELFSPDS